MNFLFLLATQYLFATEHILLIYIAIDRDAEEQTLGGGWQDLAVNSGDSADDLWKLSCESGDASQHRGTSLAYVGVNLNF